MIDFSGIMPNPTYAKVQEGAVAVREQHVDFILAVGGGSVIDCCKVISAQALLGEDIWDMEYGKGQFPAAGIPMGAVVTASGTGAEMNGGAVIHPVYYRHIVKDAADKFTRFAKVVFDVDTAQAGVDALENFIRECGLPAKLSQLKSTVEITPEVLRQVADTCNLIKSGPRQLDRDEIYEILMECI